MNMFSACSARTTMITRPPCCLPPNKLKIASRNVSEWCFMTSPRIHFICHLTRYITSILCAFIIFERMLSTLLLLVLRRDGSCWRRQTISFTWNCSAYILVNPAFRILGFFGVAGEREIWCIMYVNDTTFRLTLYCILMKWHATARKKEI